MSVEKGEFKPGGTRAGPEDVVLILQSINLSQEHDNLHINMIGETESISKAQLVQPYLGFTVTVEAAYLSSPLSLYFAMKKIHFNAVIR